jgi:hypothetical protein
LEVRIDGGVVVHFLKLLPHFLTLYLLLGKKIKFRLGRVMLAVVVKHLFKEVNGFVLGALH